MNFYAFRPTAEGKEPLGTEGRSIFRDTTHKNAYRQAEKLYGSDFRMYSFTSFYDNKTFRLVSNPSQKPKVGEL